MLSPKDHPLKPLAFMRPSMLMLGALLLLGGCFRPVYLDQSGTNISSELAAIKIDPIQDRLGHYLETELTFLLNPSSSPAKPKYHLTITPRSTTRTPVIDTISGRATAGSLAIDAEYKLFSMGNDKPIVSGLAFVVASYDRTNQRFANIRAARDAEVRDAKALAEQIKTRLIADLSKTE